VEALESNLGHADLVLMTGGVSAGVRDLVADVINHLGEAARFKVAMQPGMPQVVGRIGEVPVLGLPGNPVSSFVSFEVFVRPALRAMQGRQDLLRPTVTAALAEPVTSPPHKRSYLRVQLGRKEGRWIARPTGHQGSHVITSIASADGLAEVPEDVTSLDAGDTVTVHLLVDAS
jgi:molybdopterin molybdotransferase